MRQLNIVDHLGPSLPTVTENTRARTYTYNGMTLTFKEWHERTGTASSTLSSRVDAGRPPEEVFFKGKLPRRKKRKRTSAKTPNPVKPITNPTVPILTDAELMEMVKMIVNSNLTAQLKAELIRNWLTICK